MSSKEDVKTLLPEENYLLTKSQIFYREKRGDLTYLAEIGKDGKITPDWKTSSEEKLERLAKLRKDAKKYNLVFEDNRTCREDATEVLAFRISRLESQLEKLKKTRTSLLED